MGAAILSVFRFYIYDCKNNDGNIDSEYKKKYEEQINASLERGETMLICQWKCLKKPKISLTSTNPTNNLCDVLSMIKRYFQ